MAVSTALKRKIWSLGSRYPRPRETYRNSHARCSASVSRETRGPTPAKSEISVKSSGPRVSRCEPDPSERPAKRPRLGGEVPQCSANGALGGRVEKEGVHDSPEDLQLLEPFDESAMDVCELEDDTRVNRAIPSTRMYDLRGRTHSMEYLAAKCFNSCSRNRRSRQFLQAPSIEEWIGSLRDSLARSREPGETLRVKVLARSVRRKLRLECLTQAEIRELMEQRPPHLTCFVHDTDMTSASSRQFDSHGDYDFEEEDSSAPLERPSTPLPPEDSDSDDEDGIPTYSCDRISEHLSRREMERMGIYPDGE